MGHAFLGPDEHLQDVILYVEKLRRVLNGDRADLPKRLCDLEAHTTLRGAIEDHILREPHSVRELILVHLEER